MLIQLHNMLTCYSIVFYNGCLQYIWLHHFLL